MRISTRLRIGLAAFVAFSVACGLMAQDKGLTRPRALQLLNADDASSLALTVNLNVSPSCHVFNDPSRADMHVQHLAPELAHIMREGFITAPVSRMDQEKVNLFLNGSAFKKVEMPKSCEESFAKVWDGLSRSGRPRGPSWTFYMLNVELTPAGKAAGLVAGHNRIPVARRVITEITGIQMVSESAATIEYDWRYEPLREGKRFSYGVLAGAGLGPFHAQRLAQKYDDGWRLSVQ